MAAVAPGLLCDDRLSRMITSPGCKVGTNCVLTWRSNNSRFIGPSITQGASSRSWRRAAMKVCPRAHPRTGGGPPLDPMAEGRMTDQARPFRGRAGGLDHVRLQRPSPGVSIPRINSFSRLDVDETDAWHQVAHERLTPRDPDVARLADIRPLLLARRCPSGLNRWRLDGQLLEPMAHQRLALQVYFCASNRGRARTARPKRGDA